MKYIVPIIILVLLGGGIYVLATMGPSDTSESDMAMNQNESQNMDQSDNTDTNQDIVDIAVNAGSFSTLVTAVTEAGLVETLKGPGPFTVFAPTDEAFAKLPEGTLEAVLADPEQLTSILTYHVVSGEVMASEVVQANSLTTLQGGTLTVDTTDGVKINNANVVTTDIQASNGVIHVIDTVLLPE